MIHIKVEFHTNQYQACAWGNHHSEGVIDWPPAPWRILRSLVAGSYHVRLADKYQPTLKALLHKLAAVLPSYTLPQTTYIQHRSPRPQVDSKSAQVRPGKVLYAAGLLMSGSQNEADDQNVLYIHLPVALSESEELVLSLCLSGLTYLGRKESVATLSLVDEAPIPNTETDPTGSRIVTIADPELNVEALWNALNLSAHENYGVNRSAVFPGIRQATYRIDRLQPRSQPDTWTKQQLVTLAVSASPKVPLSLALKLTNRLHQALVSRCPAPVFTGQELGEPSQNHDHTIFQCVPNRTDRYIEQIQLYSHAGYSPEALAAIASCSYLPGIARGYDVKLSMVDLGRKEESFAVWKSTTPFFLSRFPAVRRGKPRMLSEVYQKDSPEHQVLQYLRYLPWLNLTGESSYQDDAKGLALYLNGCKAVVTTCEPFKRFWDWESECRQGRKVGRVGYDVRLKFTTPVVGPIALGYAAHYGLGAMEHDLERGWVGVETENSQDVSVELVAAN